MATRIRSTLLFDNVAGNATATMVHGLNVEDVSVMPHAVVLSNANFSVVELTAESLTVRNNTGGQLDCTARLRYWLVEHRRVAQNVLPPSNGTFARRKIYVRSAGSDTTGNGSAAHPYHTVQHALNTIPLVIDNENYIIDCSGLGTESHADGIQMPAFQSHVPIIWNMTPDEPAFWEEAAITIQAIPTTIMTLDAEITGSTTDPVTGLRTILTTLGYGLNTLQGYMLIDADGDASVIVSNTAGPNCSLETNSWIPLVAPVRVVAPSATLRQSDGGSHEPALGCVGVDATIALNGIAFTNVSGWQAFRMSGCNQPLMVQSSSFAGIYLEGVTNGEFYGCTYGGGSTTYFIDSVIRHYGSWYDDTLIDFQQLRGSSFWFACVFDGGHGFDSDPSYGLDPYIAGPTEVRFIAGVVRNTQTDGFFIRKYAAYVLQDVVCESNGNNGIYCYGGYCEAYNVCSPGGPPNSNGAWGCLALEGGLVIVDANADLNTVTGTSGDVAIGVGAPINSTWAAFYGGGIRMYDPTCAIEPSLAAIMPV